MLDFVAIIGVKLMKLETVVGCLLAWKVIESRLSIDEFGLMKMMSEGFAVQDSRGYELELRKRRRR